MNVLKKCLPILLLSVAVYISCQAQPAAWQGISLPLLYDVEATYWPPSDGEALIYNATLDKWVPGSAGAGSLSELDDVDVTGVDNGYVLIYNLAAETWEPGEMAGGSGGGTGYYFKTFSVAGQDDVVAEQSDDTMTYSAGTNIAITTTAATDTIAFATTGQMTADTMNTGQGDYELYAMNQDVETTDTVVFDDITVTSPSSIYLLSHDSFADYAENEHLDWTADQGATNINAANIPDLSGTYQPLEATLTDIADGTITENLVNTAHPWADNEVADDITIANASQIQDINAGTDITADLEEETHASEHAVSAADTVFPADPNADRYLMWDDDPGTLAWAEGSGGGTYTAGGTLLQLDGTEFSVDEGTLTDGRYCVYSAGIGLVCNSTGTGSGAAYDDIGDPDGNGSINMGSYTGTYYSATDGWAGLYVSSTDTDLTSDTYLLSLYSADSADANFKPFRIVEDTAGSPTTVFSIVGGGVTTIAGGLTVSAGVVDAGGASSLEIPNGTGPTVDAAGEIAVDTTDDQLVYYGSAKRVIAYEQEKCVVIESLAADDDGLSVGMFNDAVTITGIGAHCDGTCSTAATITLQDRAGNAMTITGTNPTVSTGTGATTFAAVTAGNGLTAGEGIEINVTNTPTADDTYTICYTYTRDAQ